MKKYVIDFADFYLKKSQIKKNKIKICIVGLTYKYGVSDTKKLSEN